MVLGQTGDPRTILLQVLLLRMPNQARSACRGNSQGSAFQPHQHQYP
jgi:hypothetical protein